MEEPQIQGFVFPIILKQFFKRLFGMSFKYNCIECGKGHDGFIAYMEGHGYSNVADFCSGNCLANYTFKHGYSFRKRITDEQDLCIVCNKAHHNQFLNEKQGYSTRAFCSKKCLKEARKTILPKIKNKEYKENFKQFLNLFKTGKTRDDFKDKGILNFECLKVDIKELLKK
jgi:hypothetical protein